MLWCCWLGVPVLLLLRKSSLAYLLPDIHSSQPYVLPWDDATVQRFNRRDAHALLAKIAKETTRDLRRKDFPDSISWNRDHQSKLSSDKDSDGNISLELNPHKMDFFHDENNSTKKVTIDNNPHLWDHNRSRRRKQIIDWKDNNKWIISDKNNYINPWNSSYNLQNSTQLDAKGAEIFSDGLGHPASWNGAHTWNSNALLQREAKKEVYRKLVTRALQQHLQVHQQLVEIVKTGDLKEFLILQWLRFITGPDAALSLLHNMHKDITRSPKHDVPDQDILKEESSKNQTSPGNDWLKAQGKISSKSDTPNFSKSEQNLYTVSSPEGNSDLKTQSEDKPAPTPATHAHLEPKAGVSHSSRSSERQHLLRLLTKLMMSSLNSTNKSAVGRRRRSEGSGVMYLPVGGTTKVTCPTAADAAGVSLAQMAFLSLCLSVFNVILNVSNNINNNNNNNNINSDNNLSNNNAQLSLNTNNGNQVNVMLPPPIPGRRRRGPLWHSV